ncbi:aminotransferase class V-fold PLP-dependent enzyme [Schumannella sp. 10F1B-5-1]|uniref:aminotransferase class V-fold PLP-dependent enzyme n=1 Tax=Schumannella sp. 10F1B-5-1 TaxID=2590780 RepID=UPI00210542F2|nr:aminotransferase class V-fold PLP-dependent enzyme [Schumannella sp. 10F1B-5-1]
MSPLFGRDRAEAIDPVLEAFVDSFGEEPGWLDFGRFGPVGRVVLDEEAGLRHVLEHVRFGSLAVVDGQHERVKRAAAAVTGFRPDQVVFQPNTTQALMQATFGVTGDIALSLGEFPALTFAAQRASEVLKVGSPQWLRTDHGRVTPGELRDQLTPRVAAVAVSLVDYRTGYLADLDGIRQVIGDRLLIVDATQGFGVVDAPLHLADVLAAGGQKWPRAGWGTGFLALSDRAVERLTPVWSGWTGTDSPTQPMDEVLPPSRSAAAFQVSNGDPVAQARFAAALEQIAETGVARIQERIAATVSRIIDLADEHGLPIASPRAEDERAGIVVLEPGDDRLTTLTASLHNHGVSATTRDGRVRLSPHASTSEETLTMLASALTAFATTAPR